MISDKKLLEAVQVLTDYFEDDADGGINGGEG